MTRTHVNVAGWGFSALLHPTSPQLSGDTLAHVSEETSYEQMDEQVSDYMGDQDGDTQVDEALDAMAEVRRQLAEVPASVVVANHAMGLYELAAIHLSSNPPDLAQAALSIDAFACLVDGLGDRIGENAPTLRDALGNIRIAFVQIKKQITDSADADEESATG